MPSDAIDLLFDWQDERDCRAATEPVEHDRSAGYFGPQLEYRARGPRLPWPPREVTEEELANAPSLRKCNRCGETFPETPEFFRYLKDRSGRKRWCRPWCKGCDRLRTRMSNAKSRHRYSVRIGNIRANAKCRGIPWGFTSNQDPRLREFYDAPCHYCGGEVIHRLGIDRVDPAQGYVPGNVVQCCGICNAMKLTHSVDEWVAHMERVLSHLRGLEPPDETS
jgi:hypothetical protein